MWPSPPLREVAGVQSVQGAAHALCRARRPSDCHGLDLGPHGDGPRRPDRRPARRRHGRQAAL
eukprot:8121909-Alexandrium_andersonii.AAC.1